MNLLQVGLRTKQVLGKIPTICKKCDSVETTKFYDSVVDKLPVGSFTKRCKCGTWIYRFHDVLKFPDSNNKTSYFTKAFVPAKEFIKNYDKKNVFEKSGFRKSSNGKYVKWFL